MAILLLLALLLAGVIVVILPALVPGLIFGGIALVIYRSVMRHHPAA